jgi:hypothetical protein
VGLNLPLPPLSTPTAGAPGSDRVRVRAMPSFTDSASITAPIAAHVMSHAFVAGGRSEVGGRLDGPVRRWRVWHRCVPAGNGGNGGVGRRSTSSLAEIFPEEDWIRICNSARLERLPVCVRDGAEASSIWTIPLETWACTVESRHETERYVGRAGAARRTISQASRHAESQSNQTQVGGGSQGSTGYRTRLLSRSDLILYEKRRPGGGRARPSCMHTIWKCQSE